MPDFDPSEYEVIEDDAPAAKFDPSQYEVIEEGAPAPAPVAAAPAPAPKAPGMGERVLQALDRAAVNTLEGPTFGAMGAAAPYINAAVDEINPFAPSMDFKDRVKQRRAEWNSKVDPMLAGAASMPVGGALRKIGLAAGTALNAAMVARNKDVEGKDIFNPDEAVDGAQTTALMSLAPPVAGEAWRTVSKYADDAAPFVELLRKGGNRAASSAVGMTKAQLNNLPVDAPDTIGGVLNAKKLLESGDTAETIAPKLKEAKTAVGGEMGGVLRSADEASGGSGAAVREVVENRRALDAQERVKDALRRKALEKRIGATASMGRARLEAMQNTAREGAETAARNQEEAGTVIGPDGLRMDVGAAPPPPSPDVAAKAAAEKFGGPKVDRPETFAAAGKEGEKVLKDAYTKEATQSTLPPVNPREFSQGVGFDAHKFIDRAEADLMPALSDPALAGLKKQAETLLKAYRKRAERGMSFSEANKMKSVLQGTIRKFQDAPVDKRFKLDLQRVLDDAIEEQLSSVVGPDRLKEYVRAKSEYGALANASKANNQLIRKEAGNMNIGLVEGMLGGGPGAAIGAAIGNLADMPAAGAAIGAMAGPPAVRALRTRGPAATARSLTRAADFVEMLPKDNRSGAEIGQAAHLPEIVRALGPERAERFIEWLRSQSPEADE